MQWLFLCRAQGSGVSGPGGIVALGYALGYGRGMQNLISTPKKYSELPTAEKMAVIRAWLEEHKAVDVTGIDLAGQGAFTDALLVASATSVRHAQSLADGVSALCWWTATTSWSISSSSPCATSTSWKACGARPPLPSTRSPVHDPHPVAHP